MRIEYENKFLDILRFNASHQFSNISLQILSIFIITFIIFSEMQYSRDDGTTATFPEAIAIGLIWYIALWIFQFTFNVFYLFSRKNKAVITTHVIEIKDDHFYEETPFNRSYFYWNGIYKVKKIWGFIVVYMTPHAALIIPSKVFHDGSERQNFYDELVFRIKNS